MGTPFMNFLEPSKLEGFQHGAPRDSQPATIPLAFLDAMEVREKVFVVEQGVPAENEFDADDPRCCHWVAYASVNRRDAPEVRDEEGNVVQPRVSSTQTVPIGTIRLVPFPHEPHPVRGGEYWNGVLKGEAGEKKDGGGGGSSSGRAAGGAPELIPQKVFGVDRATTMHDGKEPYLKLGRLAVTKEFRGHRIAGLLVNTLLRWVKANPSYFDPSIKELGLRQVGASNDKEIPRWRGLVCVHAQRQVVGVWEKWGFQIDDAMGEWWEEGIPHVGMFQRLDVENRA